MAWPVYSTRFCLNSQSGGVTYTVPAGQRAVVKSVSAFNTGATTLTVYLNVAGPTVWAADVPAQKGAALGGLLLVAYAGESVVLINQGPDLRSIVCGFLFESPALRRLDEGQVAQEPYGGEGEPVPIG